MCVAILCSGDSMGEEAEPVPGHISSWKQRQVRVCVLHMLPWRVYSFSVSVLPRRSQDSG